MYNLGPEFIDVTWAAGGGSSELTLQVWITHVCDGGQKLSRI
jgi:5,10-methylenetetrahydrofolate reductase